MTQLNKSIGFSILTLLVVMHAGAAEPYTVFEHHGSFVPKQPQACVSDDGSVHLTFGIGEEVYYSRIQIGAKLEPRSAFKVPNLSLGMRRGPRIAKAKQSIVITAIGGPQGKGRDGDLFAFRSEDDGQTWSTAIRINDVDASAREGLHAMASTDDGRLWCVWLDLREKGTQLFAASSDDGGQSWCKNILVYKSPDGSICECCHPSIVADGDSIHVLFRNSLAGNRDMYLTSSTDRGKSFSSAERLGSQHWHVNACPMDGGMLTKTPGGELISVWRRNGTIFSTGSKATSETIIESGEQPWVASNQTGVYAAWITKRDGKLQTQRFGTSEIKTIATNVRDPVIVAGHGRNQKAHLFWEHRTGDRTAIMGCEIE
jgi:hypothetical protein